MAKAKPDDLHLEYLDADAEEFSSAVQEMLKEEREIYDLLKAQKAKIAVAVSLEFLTKPTQEVKRTGYTRYGQWQIIVGDKVSEKAKNASRKTLADYRAEAEANGHAA